MNTFFLLAQADPTPPTADAPVVSPAQAPAAAPTDAPAGDPAVVESATASDQMTQADGSTQPPVVKKDPPSIFSGPWVPLLLGIVVLYFFVFRSKRTEDKKRQNMLATLKRGDRVQTIGGIMGTVVEANEQNVLLKVDESSNTKIRFSRSAVHRVVADEKADVK